jgi:hypothetical protein
MHWGAYTRDLICKLQSFVQVHYLLGALQMTEQETRLMEKYGITFETKTVFHFQSHKYERLADALNYAEKVELSSGQLESEQNK